MKARRTLIDLRGEIHPKHPPYALAPRVWSQTVTAVGAIVDRIEADAAGDRVDDAPVADDGRLEESSDVIGLAQELRAIVRDYV